MADLLIVDDDEDTVEALSELLVEEGYRVRVAHDGLQGLARLSEAPVDVILLDVEMPRLNGPEMAYELFVRDAGQEKIPIVLLSGKVDLQRVARIVGTRYFLPKPYDLAALLAMLDRALVERAPPHPAHPASEARA